MLIEVVVANPLQPNNETSTEENADVRQNVNGPMLNGIIIIACFLIITACLVSMIFYFFA